MLQPPLPCYFSYFTCSCRSDDATRMMGLLAGRLTLLDILEILGDVTDAFYWSTYIRPGRFPGSLLST